MLSYPAPFFLTIDNSIYINIYHGMGEEMGNYQPEPTENYQPPPGSYPPPPPGNYQPPPPEKSNTRVIIIVIVVAVIVIF